MKKRHNEEVFDEWYFIETYLADYSSNDDVAFSNDISKILFGDYHDTRESLQEAGLLDMTINELEKLDNEITAKLLWQSFKDYMEKEYPEFKELN